LTTSAVSQLSTSGVNLLTSAQIVGLSASQIGQLTTSQVYALTTSSVIGLSSSQLAGLTTSEVAGLTTSVLSSLSSNQKMGLLSDIAAMTTSQLTALTQTQISPLTLDLTGVDALTTANIAGLASDAFSVLTSSETSAGIQTQMIGKAGVTFDLGNTGATNASVGWITPGEGFLVNLPKGATTITNGSELFGTATVLPNGQTASDGFAALSAFDQNGNGVINASDPIFNQLQVWVDTGTGGANGTTPTGALFTLAQLNIQSLNLNAKAIDQASNGNTIGLISSFTTTDGKTHELADVWFASTSGSGSTVNQLSQALSQYTSTGSVSSVTSPVLPGGTNSGQAVAPAASGPSTAVLATALSQYNANGQLVSSALPIAQVPPTSATSTAAATNQLIGQTTTTQTTVTKNGGSSS